MRDKNGKACKWHDKCVWLSPFKYHILPFYFNRCGSTDMCKDLGFKIGHTKKEQKNKDENWAGISTSRGNVQVGCVSGHTSSKHQKSGNLLLINTAV